MSIAILKITQEEAKNKLKVANNAAINNDGVNKLIVIVKEIRTNFPTIERGLLKEVKYSVEILKSFGYAFNLRSKNPKKWITKN